MKQVIVDFDSIHLHFVHKMFCKMSRHQQVDLHKFIMAARKFESDRNNIAQCLKVKNVDVVLAADLIS